MPDQSAPPRPKVPPCVTCTDRGKVSRLEMPEYPHLHYYRCDQCGYYWATGLDGKLVLIDGRGQPN